MDKQITLQEAITAWSDRQESLAEPTPHIPPAELYELLVPSVDQRTREALMPHLMQCPICLRDLQDLAQAVEAAEIWDLAQPKAAAEEMQWPKKILTEGGKYLVEIRRSLSQANRGVITVRIEPAYRDALEGKTMRVTDDEGRLLLRGRVIDGEVSDAIEGLDGLGSRFVVQPEESTG
ncbi:MAG: hypothetical protein OEU26_23805 [Candidatus Tectomicrobia bacterium]|nr:hypothetical protein [Candidatus Tectomicrobia bacterium]